MILPQTPDTAPSPAGPVPAEFCILLNAASGASGEEDPEATVKGLLGAEMARVRVLKVARGGDLPEAIAQAVEAGHPVLVAAGGDGTIAAVAEAAIAHDRTLGILPMGTFNFVARGLGIPEELGAATARLLDGRARAVPVADVNGRLFLNNASLGIYPAILREREGIYRRWGRSRLAAYWSVLRTVMGAFRPLHLRVTVDGTKVRARTPLVFVARSAFQLDHYGLEGAEAVRQGRFALFVAPDAAPLRLALIALRLTLGGLRPGRDIALVVCDEIVVETRARRLLVAHDGERTPLATPLRFRVRPDALRVIVPDTAPGDTEA
jgi:diacylglycerol kinase family enzyme